jgi:hypothetical protein
MNMVSRNSLTLLAAAIALLGAPAMRAQTLSFNVDINTAALAASDSANAPFYLDFQLDNFGNSSLASNTATLSNFVLTGGSAQGATSTVGTATGNIASSVVLTDSPTSPTNELFQSFSPGVTNIQFTATITEKGPDVGIPAVFNASIMDNSLGTPAQLFTTAPDTASLVALTLDASNTLSNVGAYTSLTSADGNTTVTGVTASITPIPEPSTTVAILGCAVLLFAFFARRFGLLKAA